MTRPPVLVTGANGNLGRALRRVGTSQFSLIGAASPRELGGGLSIDVTSRQSVKMVIDAIRPRAIVHLAAVVGGMCEKEPTKAKRVNVDGTQNLVDAAIAAGVEKIVFISTAAVYGDARRVPLAEDEPPRPTSAYAMTKLEAERVLARGSEDFVVNVLRVFNVYGPGMLDSLVNRLLAASSAKPVQLMGLDGFVRDYVHVDDVARAIVRAVEAHSSGFRVFNVGSGIPRSNRDLLASFPQLPAGAVEVLPAIDSYSCADVAAISRDLGWSPQEPWPPDGV
jgi:UDP-glucose 4-epimerase